MKQKKISSRIESDILIGMITDSSFLTHLSSDWDRSLFRNPIIATVGDWCIKWYHHYNEAPNRHIEDIFLAEQDSINPDNAEIISKFLSKISSEFENKGNHNTQFLIDKTKEYLKRQRIKQLKEKLEDALLEDDLEYAEEEISSYASGDTVSNSSFDPLLDAKFIENAFESAPKPLFRWPGALGDLLNEHLVREGLVGYMGPEKRGKTWELMECARRGFVAGNNVIFFGTGDMSKKQIGVRLGIMNAHRSNLAKYCTAGWKPVLDCKLNQTGMCKKKCCVGKGTCLDSEGNLLDPAEVEDYAPCSVCRSIDPSYFVGAVWWEWDKSKEPLGWREVVRVNERFARRGRGKTFKSEFFPTNSCSVGMIDARLKTLHNFEGWTPDIVVIDYADILAAENSKHISDERTKQNHTWMALRRLSQEWHCLVITATQTDSESRDSYIILPKHFSEDKRKFAHATVMVGLNQTLEEKENNLSRKNIVLGREGDFSPLRCVSVIQDFRRGRAFMGSWWTENEKGDQ